MSHYLNAPKRTERAAVLDRMATYWQADRHAELRTVAAKALADVGRPVSDIEWLFARKKGGCNHGI